MFVVLKYQFERKSDARLHVVQNLRSYFKRTAFLLLTIIMDSLIDTFRHTRWRVWGSSNSEQAFPNALRKQRGSGSLKHDVLVIQHLFSAQILYCSLHFLNVTCITKKMVCLLFCAVRLFWHTLRQLQPPVYLKLGRKVTTKQKCDDLFKHFFTTIVFSISAFFHIWLKMFP